MKTAKGIFNRMERLVGEAVMRREKSVKVIIFGVGGVGSWCAESLVRSGVRHLTIVDSDRVSVSNINRQLMATTLTVGMVKVEALKTRLLEISPDAVITAVQSVYTEETASSFSLDDYDYVVDAIDSLRDKALLILCASRSKAVLFSSMGAALKMDPTRVCVAEFWKVKGCPLAAALRRKFRHNKTLPQKKFNCVYSEELLDNLGQAKEDLSLDELASVAGQNVGKPELMSHKWDDSKAQINGSVVHITAIFGFTIAGMIINDIYRETLAAE